MGNRYTNGVIACLYGSLDEWNPYLDDHSRQLQDHLQHFQEKIVDPLAACNA